MPTGRISRKIYEGLVSARKFDQYHRPQSTKLSEAEQLIADMKATFGNVGAAGDDADEDEDDGKPKIKPLVTPKWVIGYKQDEHGPPGLAPPRNGVLNSEGNEHFYSYDGLWKDGKMHGAGTYKFADGMLYVGHFVNGQPEGEGKAQYPGGTTYNGHWKNGKHDGGGRMEYASGSTYDGIWKEGRRQGEGTLKFASGVTYRGHFNLGRYHGRGELHSPTTGFTYVGTWHAGFINGPGALVWPDGTRDTRNWVTTGGMTIRQVIDFALAEKATDAAKRTRERDQAFSVRLAVKLKAYVENVKSDIALEREEKALEAEAERRAQIAERKKKSDELRERALAMLAKSADDGAGDIVNSKKDAADDI
mmetsp:Transcript_1233/g.3681  ORF Transcript_1233/g.3681 Transcript_1233/m.3681 type:complete len:363 (-) Transcript_1233:25-1113(-)